MTKIENLIQEFVDPHVFKINGYEALQFVMKEYAEWYAKKCLDTIAKNIHFEYADTDVEGYLHKEIVGLDYEKTFDLKLPRHE